MPTTDPAELETEQRRLAGPIMFDRTMDAMLGLTASNAMLVKTMRICLLVGGVAFLILMAWNAFVLHEMQGTLSEIRGMLQVIIEQSAKGRP